MANPCQNCHSTPDTDLLPPHTSSEICSAAPFWPEDLAQEAQPKIEVSSWVRNNFAATMAASAPEPPTWEFAMGAAELNFELIPKNFSLRFHPDAPRILLRGNRDAALSGHLTVKDHQIPLTMQNLLEFEGIAIMVEGLGSYLGMDSDGVWFYNLPDRLSVGDYGALHFITEVNPSEYEAWTDPGYLGRDLGRSALLRHYLPIDYYFPNAFAPPMTAPLGREDPAKLAMCYLEPPPGRHDYSRCCEAIGIRMQVGAFETCTFEDHPVDYCAPFEYPDPEHPKLDFGLTRLIPSHFREWYGRLPSSYNLDTLLGRARLKTSTTKKKRSLSLEDFQLLASGKSPEHFLDLLKSAHLEFDLKELKDFFLPGLLDLGPSTGKLKIHWSDARGTLKINAPTFNLAFEAMDYPHSTDVEPSPVRFHGGELRAGEPVDPASPVGVSPGLHLEWNPQTGETQVQANLHFHGEATLPILGRVQIDLPLELSTRLNRGGELMPEKTLLWISDLQIRREHPQSGFETHLELMLGDTPETDGDYYRETTSPHPHFNVRLNGKWQGENRSQIYLEGFVPMSRESSQAYAWEDLKHDLVFNGKLALDPEKKSPLTSYFSINTFKPAPFNSQKSQDDFGVVLKLDMHRGEEVKDELLLPASDWLVEGGRIQISRVKLWDPGHENTIRASADALRLGDLELIQPYFRARISQVEHSEDQTQFSIPHLRFRANQASPLGDYENPQGILQGPVELQLEPCGPEKGMSESLCGGESGELQVLWDHADNQLHFNKLNLVLSAYGLQLPKKLHRQQKTNRRELRRAGLHPETYAHSLGLDGRVGGHFQVDLKDGSGEGDLRILGDREGDVYFLDPKGNRVGPPLISQTKWRFTRFDRFLMDKGYALGRFRLSTRIDTNALSKFGLSLNYQTNVIMGHRDVMFKPGGIQAANLAYYRKLFTEIARKGGLNVFTQEESP